MFKSLSRPAIPTAVFAVAVVAVAALGSASAAAVAAPLDDSRVVIHFDLARSQTAENIALGPGGTEYVSLGKACQIVEVTRGYGVRAVATLPKPADGGVHSPLGFALTLGVVRAHDGTLYFLYASGTADLTGVWRLRPGGVPERITALPADSLPNGLGLDEHSRTLYVADSEGAVWSLPTSGGTATAWATGSELAPRGSLGANGLKVHNGAVWVTNLSDGTLLRYPILPDGRAGDVQTRATGLTGVDDFTFTGDGDQVLAALDTVSEVALVRPDGSHTIVLTGADGLENPTSIAVRHDTVYVLSAAWVTQKDPNMLVAHLDK
jgi:sugar lactone lactonase YvrE